MRSRYDTGKISVIWAGSVTMPILRSDRGVGALPSKWALAIAIVGRLSRPPAGGFHSLSCLRWR